MQNLIVQNLLKNKKRYGLAAVGLIICLAASMLIKGYSSPKTVTDDVPLVRTMVVRPDGAGLNFTYSGEVRGRYESQLAFQVGGKIIKRNVDLGKAVRSGDVLMQIDPKDLQQVVNIGSAQVYSAESQLKLAETNLNRYRRLYEQNAISRAQLDQYQSAYDAAVAATRQASAQYVQGANQLDYSALVADSDGVVASIDAEAGQVVSAGQSVITLVRDGEREIEISVPENRVEEVRKATQVKATFWALPNKVIDGKIREIAPMADKVSRTYKIRVALINAPPEIKLGMTATVTIANSGNQQSVTYIPLSAIYQTSDTPSVWVVNEDVVHLKPVKVGTLGDGKVAVSEGLNAGDRIVTAGVHKLREGQKVRTGGGEAL